MRAPLLRVVESRLVEPASGTLDGVRLCERASLAGAVTSAQAAARLLGPSLEREPVKCLDVLYLDAQAWPVGVLRASRGGPSSTVVDPRSVLGPALRLGGVDSLVLAHCHPTGVETPSTEDRAVTERMLAASALVGLRMLDHLVIAGPRALSIVSGLAFAWRKGADDAA